MNTIQIIKKPTFEITRDNKLDFLATYKPLLREKTSEWSDILIDRSKRLETAVNGLEGKFWNYVHDKVDAAIDESHSDHVCLMHFVHWFVKGQC